MQHDIDERNAASMHRTWIEAGMPHLQGGPLSADERNQASTWEVPVRRYREEMRVDGSEPVTEAPSGIFATLYAADEILDTINNQLDSIGRLLEHGLERDVAPSDGMRPEHSMRTLTDSIYTQAHHIQQRLADISRALNK